MDSGLVEIQEGDSVSQQDGGFQGPAVPYRIKKIIVRSK